LHSSPRFQRSSEGGVTGDHNGGQPTSQGAQSERFGDSPSRRAKRGLDITGDTGSAWIAPAEPDKRGR